MPHEESGKKDDGKAHDTDLHLQRTDDCRGPKIGDVLDGNEEEKKGNDDADNAKNIMSHSYRSCDAKMPRG
jgi:hypothetical protein